MKLKYIFYVFLIVLNLISLYVIIELSNYDEMIGYLKDGKEKFNNPKETALVFLFTCIVNLLFVCVVFMKTIIFRRHTVRGNSGRAG